MPTFIPNNKKAIQNADLAFGELCRDKLSIKMSGKKFLMGCLGNVWGFLVGIFQEDFARECVRRNG